MPLLSFFSFFFYKLLLYNEIRIFFSLLRTIDLITWDNVKFNSLHERKLRYNKQFWLAWQAKLKFSLKVSTPLYKLTLSRSSRYIRLDWNIQFCRGRFGPLSERKCLKFYQLDRKVMVVLLTRTMYFHLIFLEKNRIFFTLKKKGILEYRPK